MPTWLLLLAPSYFRASNGERWWRLLGVQVGWYPHGRRPLFSERHGSRRPPLRICLPSGAEITVRRLHR